jgi:hypothetical protein
MSLFRKGDRPFSPHLFAAFRPSAAGASAEAAGPAARRKGRPVASESRFKLSEYLSLNDLEFARRNLTVGH